VSDRPSWGAPDAPDAEGQPPDDAWVPPGEVREGSADDARPTDVPAVDDDPPRLPPPPGQPAADPNSVAVDRAGLSHEAADWLRQVAAQVEPRLDRVAPSWRGSPNAGAARACAFGLLLGYLSRTYPHARGDLSRTAEAHPSYTTLQAGNRLATLEQMSADPQRMTAWLGPLVDVSDPQRMRRLLD
jgi:hypothetical protein